VSAIATVGIIITASNSSHRMGLFTFFFVETAAVCVGRWLENTLVSIFICFIILFSFPYI
jgi:hypothetical protein